MSPSFFFLIASRFLVTFAIQMQSVMLGWQMYAWTKDPLKLGLIGLVEAVPALSLALFAGYFVDRHNPLRIYRGVVVVSLCSIGVAFTAQDPVHGPTTLYIAAFITGIARGFWSPSMQALIPRLVERPKLSVAIAWSTTAMKFASILGPALAGLLMGWKGYSFAYAFALSLIGGGFVMAWLVHYEHPASAVSADRRPQFFDELVAGVRFVFSHDLLLPAMSLDMFAVLFGGVTALLPIYAEEVLHVGPQGLGMLRASMAVGAVIMSLALIRRPILGNAGRLLLQVVAGFGVCILVFALSRNFLISCAALAAAGALDSVSMVVRGAIVQLCSPEHMRGRVASVNSIFIGSSNELGALESGVAAKLMGTVPAAVFGGVMTLVTVAWVAWRFPRIRNVDLTQL